VDLMQFCTFDETSKFILSETPLHNYVSTEIVIIK